MVQKYAVTYTGCDDLYLVFTRFTDAGPSQLYCTAATNEQAKLIAAQRNLEEQLRQCALIVEQADLTTDAALVALSEAVQALEQIVRWDMDGYMAQRRVEEAKNLAAGIVELEATA